MTTYNQWDYHISILIGPPQIHEHAMQHRHLPHHEWTRPLQIIGYKCFGA